MGARSSATTQIVESYYAPISPDTVDEAKVDSNNDDAKTQGILPTAQHRSKEQPKLVDESIATPAIQRKVLALKDTDSINRRQNAKGRMQRRPKRSRDFLRAKLQKIVKVPQAARSPVASGQLISILRSRPRSASFVKSKQKQGLKNID